MCAFVLGPFVSPDDFLSRYYALWNAWVTLNITHSREARIVLYLQSVVDWDKLVTAVIGISGAVATALGEDGGTGWIHSSGAKQ